MGSIGRYIFRTTGAFLLVLVSVTALMWITQALRAIGWMTNQGRRIWVWGPCTVSTIPLLVLIGAGVAFLVAICYVRNGRAATAVLPFADWGGLSGSAIAALALLRGLDFVGAPARPHPPATLLAPYVALAMALTAALGLSYRGGSRGLGIEPRVFVAGALAGFMEPARKANLAGQTQ